jgi:hypothetical protein
MRSNCLEYYPLSKFTTFPCTLYIILIFFLLVGDEVWLIEF